MFAHAKSGVEPPHSRRRLGAAEGGGDDLIGGGPGFVGGEFFGLFEGVSEGGLEGLEWGEVSAIAGLDDFFHAVIARDANGVGGAHLGEVGLVVSDFFPEGEPVLRGFWVVEEGEEVAFAVGLIGGVAGEVTEEEGEVDLLVGEEFEGGADEVGIGFGGDAELGAETRVVVTTELFGVTFEGVFGEGFGFIEFGV